MPSLVGSEMCIRDSHKQQKRPRTFLAILKYVAVQQPTDRQFRYSNRPIRCSTQLSRYYGRYHEHRQDLTDQYFLQVLFSDSFESALKSALSLNYAAKCQPRLRIFIMSSRSVSRCLP